MRMYNDLNGLIFAYADRAPVVVDLRELEDAHLNELARLVWGEQLRREVEATNEGNQLGEFENPKKDNEMKRLVMLTSSDHHRIVLAQNDKAVGYLTKADLIAMLGALDHLHELEIASMNAKFNHVIDGKTA